MPETANEAKLTKHEGFIALFDILGYVSFLEAHATPEQRTYTALNAILEAKFEVPARITQQLGDYIDSELKEIKWVVFSDTILIAAPYDSQSVEDKDRKFLLMTVIGAHLQRYMFDSGLPLRGAITEGEFVLAETCFAGQPIVKAHRLSTALDLATCVIDDDIISRQPRMKKSHLIHRYRTPLKESKEADQYILFPLCYTPPTGPGWHDTDIKQLVTEAFWKYGKQIGLRELPKLAHTELLFHFIRSKMGQDFR